MRLSLIAATLATAIALCEGSTKMVIGYFPNWLYANYPVENIPFNKYTHINYAFAIMNKEDNLPSFTDDWAVESSLPKIVNMAHAANTKVLLSIGGWTGSQKFSPMVASAESRKKFIDWSLNFIEKYNTDGVDLDWEYPGKQAAGCNEFADNDADNYLLLLKELRQALDTKFPNTHKEISMAVHVQPFIKSGTPMTDVKEFVPYFDHINLMTYDINGAWASTTGPNAPFKSEQGKGSPFSFVESIRDWKAAGVPANKITAGLAFYGRTMKSKVDMSLQRNQFQDSEVGAPKGDSDDAYWNDPYCSVDTAGLSGIWKWANIRKEGLIKDDMVTSGEGWQRYWDEVSQTPWLFNPLTKHFITYDDPQSINIKVEHALCEDLAGVMVWDIHQDNGELVDAANRIHQPAPANCENLTANKNAALEPNASTSDANPGVDAIFNDSEDLDGEDGEWLSNANIAANVASQVPSPVIPQEIPSIAPQEISSVAPHLESIPSSDTSSIKKDTEKDVSEDFSGKSCPISGQERCAFPGKSGKWLTCNFNKWLERTCPPGLVCKEDRGAIFCDIPPTELRADAGPFSFPPMSAFDYLASAKVPSSVSSESITGSATTTSNNKPTHHHFSFPGFPPISIPGLDILSLPFPFPGKHSTHTTSATTSGTATATTTGSAKPTHNPFSFPGFGHFPSIPGFPFPGKHHHTSSSSLTSALSPSSTSALSPSSTSSTSVESSSSTLENNSSSSVESSSSTIESSSSAIESSSSAIESSSSVIESSSSVIESSSSVIESSSSVIESSSSVIESSSSVIESSSSVIESSSSVIESSSSVIESSSISSTEDSSSSLPENNVNPLPGDDVIPPPGDDVIPPPGDDVNPLPGDDFNTLPGNDFNTLPGNDFNSLPGGHFDSNAKYSSISPDIEVPSHKKPALGAENEMATHLATLAVEDPMMDAQEI